MMKKLSWWQLAFASLVLSAIGGLASGRPKRKERKVYELELKQAPWAPPGWVFGPAWTLNNFFLLNALQQELIEYDGTQKDKLLLRQAFIWTIFFTFGYVYFRKNSTILAAVWTMGDAYLALRSFMQARKVSRNISLNYLPLLSWTVFASSVAAYQAVKNKDVFLQLDPRKLIPFSAS